MTSFSPLPESRRPTRPPGDGWLTGPNEDWHTASQPTVPSRQPPAPTPGPAQGPQPGVPWHDQALAARPEPASGQPDYPAGAGIADPLPATVQVRRPVRDGDEAWAMLGYLGVPFVSILAPLAVFLVRGRGSDYVRQHATQALNLSITIALYNICAVIVAGMLALDAVGVALLIAVPAALVLWLVALAYLVRAAVRASLGEFYQLPRWICATIAR
jgi:uncharacterized Tic20 family protein